MQESHGKNALTAALQRLAALPDLEKERQAGAKLGLENMEALLRALGDPQVGMTFIHVGGSKGKGTTVLFLEALLRAGGEYTGAFLSPHLCGYEERFLLAGKPVDPARLARVLERVSQVVGQAPGAGFFDVLTAAAILLFREEGVGVAILEVGLGGRLDSTNVISPALTVVTNVEREHEDMLGRGIIRVAREKAGIIKPGVPLVTGCGGRALEVMLDRSGELGAPCQVLGRDFDIQERGREESGLVGEFTAIGAPGLVLDTGIRVAGQLRSLALARQACLLFTGHYPPLPNLQKVAHFSLPGRFEVISREADWLLDGAHTGRTLVSFAREVQAWFPERRKLLIFGVGRDKEWRRPLGVISGLVAETWLVNLPGSRGESATTLAGQVSGKCRSFATISQACESLAGVAGGGDLILVTGSYHLVGPVRAWLVQAKRNV